MQRYLLWIDSISTWVGKTFAWTILALTLITVYDVTMRKLFSKPWDCAFDTELILYGTLFMMAGAYTLARNGHVRGDVLYGFFKPRTQAGLDLALYFLFFIPGVAALAYAGIDFARESWASNEGSSYSTCAAPYYAYKTLIPIAGFLVLLQGLAEIVRCVRCLKSGQWPRRLHDVEEVNVEEIKHTLGLDAQAAEPPAAARRALSAPSEPANKGMRIGVISLGIVIAAIFVVFLSADEITSGHYGLLMLGLIVVAIMLGFPTAFTLMGLGMIFSFINYRLSDPDLNFGELSDRVFNLMVNSAYGAMTTDVLISVPLFIFMGYLVERANIIDKLFKSLQVSMGNLPGALGVATIVTCAIFATATGIIGATVTLMGLLALPAMLRAGYDVRLGAGAITAGGCLGILIPPSVMLILYGATAGVPVTRLYAGAFLPGLMLTLLYIIYIMVRAKLNPSLAPKLPPEEYAVPLAQKAKMLLTSFVPLALLIAFVLGSIIKGWATPTEAAAVGAFGGLLLALAYRQLTWTRLKEAVFLTARAAAMVCWLFVGARIFSAAFGLLGGQELIKDWVLSFEMTGTQFLLLSQVIIFLLGWPLEWTEIIVIFMPIFLPLLDHFQIDPLFFGLLVALNLQTAFLSPPVAMAAFYLKGVAPPHVTLNQIFRGMMPYMLIQIFAMFLLYMFPQIGLWLPQLQYGK